MLSMAQLRVTVFRPLNFRQHCSICYYTCELYLCMIDESHSLDAGGIEMDFSHARQAAILAAVSPVYDGSK